jgi:hypothetical protein
MASLKLKFPNGGETLFVDQKSPITWQATGITTTNVLIVELVDQATKMVYLIDDAAPLFSEWPYQWTVARLKNGTIAPAGSQYVIRIKTAGANPLIGQSSASFAIESAKKIILTTPTSFLITQMTPRMARRGRRVVHKYHSSHGSQCHSVPEGALRARVPGALRDGSPV